MKWPENKTLRSSSPPSSNLWQNKDNWRSLMARALNWGLTCRQAWRSRPRCVKRYFVVDQFLALCVQGHFASTAVLTVSEGFFLLLASHFHHAEMISAHVLVSSNAALALSLLVSRTHRSDEALQGWWVSSQCRPTLVFSQSVAHSSRLSLCLPLQWWGKGSYCIILEAAVFI